MKNSQITFCTVVMNRVEHIKKTLLRNILDNKHPETSFLVLDYGSTDGLREYIRDNFQKYLKNGKLVYCYAEAELFDRSHSRNMMIRQADGKYICNLDADNYTGKDFDLYLLDIFIKNKGKNALIVADTTQTKYTIRDAFGRFAVEKRSFMEVTGYDERMKYYGSEDIDLYNRLELLGCQRIVIEDVKYLKAIEHSDDLRIKNEKLAHKMAQSYVYHHEEADKSSILIKMVDNTCELIEITPQNENITLPFTVVSHLVKPSVDEFDLSAFTKLPDNLQEELLMVYPMTVNQFYLNENLKNKVIAPNKHFGVGAVEVNFGENNL